MVQTSLDEVAEDARSLLKSLSKTIIGYDSEKRLILTAMLSNGHVLLEGVPGIAKTTIAKSLARLMGLSEEWGHEAGGLRYKGFSRIQFTPDLLPSDVTGSMVFNPSTRDFEVRFGPVFAYLLLADEINRAVPRTQSALLQAMQERQVTIGNETYRLEYRSEGKWFLVIATQNPVEQEGTYPLPEAQLDRFLFRIIMGYPESLEEEKEILRLHRGRLVEPLEELEPQVSPGWLVGAQETVAREVEVPEDVLDFVTRIVRATRPEIFKPVSRFFELGASPRAAIMIVRASQAHALLRGDSTVSEEDVTSLLFPALNHRLIPSMETVVEYEEKHGRLKARLEVVREGIKFVADNLP